MKNFNEIQSVLDKSNVLFNESDMGKEIELELEPVKKQKRSSGIKGKKLLNSTHAKLVDHILTKCENTKVIDMNGMKSELLALEFLDLIVLKIQIDKLVSETTTIKLIEKECTAKGNSFIQMAWDLIATGECN